MCLVGAIELTKARPRGNPQCLVQVLLINEREREKEHARTGECPPPSLTATKEKVAVVGEKEEGKSVVCLR